MANKDPLDFWKNRVWADQSKSKPVREELVRLVERLNWVEYIPYWPWPIQIAIRERTELEGLIGGEPRASKAQPLSAAVMTPFGPSTMGKMKVGSLVSNPDGTVATVIGVYPRPAQQIYRVTFQDGGSTRVTGDHLWLVYQSKRHLKAKREYADGTPVDYRVRTTNQLIEWMAKDRYNTQSACVPMTQPVQFTVGHRAPIGIDPYVMGLLLGDGSFRGDTPRFSTADESLLNVLRSFYGEGVSHVSHYDHYIRSAELRHYLRHYKLWGHRSEGKFVPDRYKYGSISERWSVLRGLMDTDGTVDITGRVSFTSVSKQLADDVQFLVQSLGGKATMGYSVGSYKLPDGERKECLPVYHLYIRGRNNADFFSLPRKQTRCGPPSEKPTTFLRRMVSIEPDGFEEAQCIQVDHPNNLYLTDDFIVTHNSVGVLMDNVCDTTVEGFTAIFFRRTIAELKRKNGLIDTLRQWFQPFPEWSWSEELLEWRNKKYNSALVFAWLGQRGDEDNLLGVEFQSGVYEELTRMPFTPEWNPYRDLFHRFNVPIGMPVRKRIRATSNPGGDNECVPYGDVLTPNGWVDIRDMRVGDPVYTVADDGTMVSSHVAQVHKSHYDGNLMQVTARGLSMICTPNHRVAKVGGARGADRGRRFTMVPISELPGQATILRSVRWEGTPLGDFTVRPYNLSTRKTKLDQPKTLSGIDYCELLGWFLSEGCTVDRDRRFEICQLKHRSAQRLRAFLDRVGFKYQRGGETGRSHIIYSPDWWAYLRRFGKSDEKYIPPAVKQASRIELRKLFDTLVEGDGHWVGEHSGTYYSTSKQLADDVAEVALKLGYVVLVTEVDHDNPRWKHGYCVHFKQTQSGGTELLTGNHIYDVDTNTKRRSDIAVAPYQGDVYCIGVPDTHNFIIRQNGCVWISGNSWVMEYFLNPTAQRFDIGLNGSYMLIQRARPDPDPEKDFGGIFYIHAQVEDNRAVDAHSYRSGMARMEETKKQQFAHGMWGVVKKGGIIDTSKIRTVPTMPWNVMARMRSWDKASSEAPKNVNVKRLPPRTAGVRVSRLMPGAALAMWGKEFADIEFVIEHAIAGYWVPFLREDMIDKIAGGGQVYIKENSLVYWGGDGFQTIIVHEQEPGSGGLESAEATTKRLLRLGYNISHIKSVYNKEARVAPLAATVGRGMYGIVVDGTYDHEEFLAELAGFPKNPRKDYPDALGLAHGELTKLVPDYGAVFGGEGALDMTGFSPYSGAETDQRLANAIAGMRGFSF